MVTKAGSWGNSASFGIHEAWVEFKLNEASNIKIGRQEWNYDNMRILCYRNWATTALSYDGLLYRTQNNDKGLNLDLGLSYNNNGSPIGYADNSDWQQDKLKSMNFLHIQKTINSNSYIALLTSVSAKTDTSNMYDLWTGTHGLYAVYNKGKKAENGLFGSIEGYYQHGTDMKRGSDGKYKNIEAYLIAADLGFRTLNQRLEISAGAELISGHDYSNTDTEYNNTRHSFDMLYGMRIPAYGGYLNHYIIQDSYLVGTKSGGYIDPFIRINFALNQKNIIEVTGFNPILSTKVKTHTQINPITQKPMGTETDPNGNLLYWKGNLGQYIDINYTHKFSKELVMKAGLSYANISDIKNQMAFGYKNAANKELHSLGTNYFGWVMLIVKPTFFQ